VLLALSEDLYLTNKLLGILFRPSEVLLIGTLVPAAHLVQADAGALIDGPGSAGAN
jgi:hypothetical protein